VPGVVGRPLHLRLCPGDGAGEIPLEIGGDHRAWAAGGATDVLFRAIGAVFPKHANGQQLIVKNIPAAGRPSGMPRP